MTVSRIGRGAIVTLGAAASMAWAAGAANAACNPPQPPTPNTHDHNPHGHGHTYQTGYKPATACAVSDNDVEYAELGPDGKPLGGWHNAVRDRFQGNSPEPTYGYQVRLNPAVSNTCTGTVDISLASYDTGGPTWDTSKGVQTFVGYSHIQLSEQSPSQTITVKLPETANPANCFGQIDLYFKTTIYDGGTDLGHGPLPNHDSGKGNYPTSDELITAWNGGHEGVCATTTTTTPPPVVKTTPPPAVNTTPPTTAPTTHPSTPTPKPSTPATTPDSPATPTLAHTGANVGEVSLVALAFFGAGGTAMFASRKAKAAGARKH